MKTTLSKAIVYDDQCPLCQWYTGEFVKYGMLHQENRLTFRNLHKHADINQIDLERAKSEIPLVDLQGNQTLYGIDSLIYLLKTKFPNLMQLAKVKPIYWFFKRLYFLVSFNRRIISGAHKTFYVCDCTPPFSLKYRLAYLALAGVLASLFTWVAVGMGVQPLGEVLSAVNQTQIYVAIGAGWVLQGFFTFPLFKDKKEWLEYAGHLATLAIMGSAILMPAVVYHSIFPMTYVPALIVSVAFSFTLMLTQHITRVKSGEWSQWFTASWAFFLLAAFTIGLTLRF